MGGKALALVGVQAGRLPRAEYFEFVDKTLPALRTALPMLRIDSVPALRDKLDFGDCDLVVSVKPEFDIKHGDWPGIYHAAMG